jgi:hypothetical protein
MIFSVFDVSTEDVLPKRENPGPFGIALRVAELLSFSRHGSRRFSTLLGGRDASQAKAISCPLHTGWLWRDAAGLMRR